jgi:hypothetical protein
MIKMKPRVLTTTDKLYQAEIASRSARQHGYENVHIIYNVVGTKRGNKKTIKTLSGPTWLW